MGGSPDRGIVFIGECGPGDLEGGFEARAEAAGRMLESIGFTVIDYYWLVSVGEWHAAVLVEVPDDLSAAEAARTTFQQVSAGAIVGGRFLRLAKPADVDVGKQLDYFDAGSMMVSGRRLLRPVATSNGVQLQRRASRHGEH